jgi:hypothetical protein
MVSRSNVEFYLLTVLYFPYNIAIKNDLVCPKSIYIAGISFYFDHYFAPLTGFVPITPYCMRQFHL